MKTISSKNSLIYWIRNINGSNISNVNSLILKENYISVFSKLFDLTSSNGIKVKFLEMWHHLINEECKAVCNKLKNYSSDPNSIALVVNKFRGNIGEIFAEKIFTDFGYNFDIIPTTYDTVDPANEEFLDAVAKHPIDNLPIGIQIKNYHKDFLENTVSRETFVKSMAMTTHWVQDTKLIDYEKLPDFFKIPRQIIFSYTNIGNSSLLSDYVGSVRFIGPKEIAKLNFEQKPYLFQQIVLEISSI